MFLSACMLKWREILWSFCAFELKLPKVIHWFTEMKVQSRKNKGHNTWGKTCLGNPCSLLKPLTVCCNATITRTDFHYTTFSSEQYILPSLQAKPYGFQLGVPRKFGTNTWRCLLAVCSTGPAEVAFIIKMMFAEKGQPSQTGPVLIIQCDVQSLGKASTLK